MSEKTKSEWDILTESAEAIEAALPIRTKAPKVALVLGSGLGAFADTLQEAKSLDYGEIPHFVASKVPGHAGKLVLGSHHDLPVVVMQGRVHHYEGHDITQVVRPTRVLGRLGIETLIITNAAGTARKDLSPGAIVAIRDHLNLLGSNPLRGPNDERLGTRFPDMSQAYDPELRALAKATARKQGWEMHEGVYACMPGPSYETPAEVQMVARMGGDLVGMSTVPEVIAARHMGLEILGLSCVTNMAAGLSDTPLSHEEVAETAARVKETFLSLLDGLLQSLAKGQGQNKA